MKVLVVDDHKIMREGLRSLLEKQPDIEEVAEAESAREALTLVEEFMPNLVIIDVVMPSLNGIEATRRI
ncbi:MAG: response regulator transcription factor, partial [Chloroflexota bacterium]